MNILINPHKNLRSIYNYYEETQVQKSNLPKATKQALAHLSLNSKSWLQYSMT